MIAINNLSVQFTGQNLFENVTFNIGDHDRIGLVGKNGAGKSTLMKILSGQQEPETGTMVIANGQTVGYLPQEMIPDSVGTVIEETLTAFSHIDELEVEQQRLTEEIGERSDYESANYMRLIEQLNEVTERIAVLGGRGRREAAEKILTGLGFRHEDFDRLVAEFSGGWQMRVELAKLLLRKPDFILLDEPTNHLDINSIEWLESFLANYGGTVMVVSHDRTFLDHVTQRTIEITAGRIYDYRCNYSGYVEQMQQRRATQMARLSNQQREIAQIEAFIERFRYKATKSKQVQSRIKMLERMDEVTIDEVTTGTIHFQFPPAPHSGKIAIECKGVGKHYGAKKIFSGIELLIESGSRLAFVGRNGEGKTTMARIIVGELNDYEGQLRLGQGVQIGYYAQNQAAMLNGEKTVYETIDDIAIGDMRPKIRNLLGSFLFDDEAIEKKVKVLSGGEKARLALAKLLLTPANLLVLDEPTNHLDMDSKDILKNALLQYKGTLIVVSHDRDFLQGLTESLYEFRDGGIHEYKGDIFEFLEWRRIEDLKALETEKQSTHPAKQPKSEGKANYEKAKEKERELRKKRNAVAEIEKKIEETEEAVAEKERILSSGQAPEEAFYAEYQQLKSRLAELMDQWEEASVELDEAAE